MNATRNRARDSKLRAQAVAAVLLVFLFIAQPAFAFASARSTVAPCRARGQSCCCIKKAESPPGPTRSCCSENQSESREEPDAGKCDCRVGTGEVPEQTPALPLDEGSAASKSSPDKWVRVHADLFAQIAYGPPASRTLLDELSGAPPGAGVYSTKPGQHSGVGAWALLLRGVSGFLAVLSVART